MVSDVETDTLYNVFFSGDKPAIGQRIFFTATPRYGPNRCMQGKPVDVQNWAKRKLTCSEPGTQAQPILARQPDHALNMEGLGKEVDHVYLFHVIAGFQEQAHVARERGRVAGDVDNPL